MSSAAAPQKPSGSRIDRAKTSSYRLTSPPPSWPGSRDTDDVSFGVVHSSALPVPARQELATGQRLTSIRRNALATAAAPGPAFVTARPRDRAHRERPEQPPPSPRNGDRMAPP